jgi:RNase P subunit RPR2
MKLGANIFKIWKNKGQILEGIMNNIFKKEDVELVAEYRMFICRSCKLYDEKGEGCTVPGTQPCCNELKGGCGCSLAFKTRALSSECPLKKWKAEMTEEEEDQLNKKLGI